MGDIQRLIEQNNFLIATNEQKADIEKYLQSNTDYKDFTYGITHDTLFIKSENTIYVKKFPCTVNGFDVPNFRTRKIHRENFIKKEKMPIFCGMHIFINEREIENVEKESETRASFKTVEHKNGDNQDNKKRIETGSFGEMAFELFSGIKTTDFSAASFHSKKFLVADNQTFNIGIKSCLLKNSAYVIETPAKHHEVLMTKIDDNFGNSHMVMRGFVTPEELDDKRNHCIATLVSNPLLSKSILFKTKIGFTPHYTSYHIPYSLNDLNFNKQNNHKYISESYIIDSHVNFTKDTRKLSAFLQKRKEEINSIIIYVDIKCFGFENLKEVSDNYCNKNPVEKQEFIQFAKDLNVGVVFYDDKYTNQIIKKYGNHFFNVEYDTQLVGVLDQNGILNKKLF